MLQELRIKDIALIKDVSLRFSPGLNILTGETGAGKSILIDALGLTLGSRGAGGDLVRHRSDHGIVEATFDIPTLSSEINDLLIDNGIPDVDEGIIICVRELNRATGKSICRINGRTVTVSTLRALGELLVDVHGQHDHQSLLQSSKHLELLDSWGGAEIAGIKSALQSLWKELKAYQSELSTLKQDERDQQRALDLYKYQVAEIDEAALKEGELEELTEERDRLANSERIASSISIAIAAVCGTGSGDGALGSLNDAAAGIEKALHYDQNLLSTVESVRAAISHAEDASLALTRYFDRLDSGPERLETVENRLQAIKALQKKYGEKIEEILEFRALTAGKLFAIEHSDERAEELEHLISIRTKEAMSMATKLSRIRQLKASDFSNRIQAELHDVGMSATEFCVSVTPQALGETGIDSVEFLISPNPGEPLRPLTKIASGGEISRVMLSLKSTLAGSSAIPTMIFDEIDVGIGGRTAHSIGGKLVRVARGSQLLCITHLAQVASMPASHFAIEKSVESGETVVRVRELDAAGRVAEITRMLGGEANSLTANNHAKEMLSDAAGLVK